MRNPIIPALSYDILTPLYDSALNVFGFGLNQRRHILQLLNIQPHETLLDIGAGTGTFLMITKETHSTVSVTGVDIDENILQIARQKIAQKSLDVQLVKSSAAQMPFINESFDVLVSTLIFHHLPTDVKLQAIQEAKRVLKLNGRFLLVDFGKADRWYVRCVYAIEQLLRIPEAETARDNVLGKIPQYLAEAGFHVQEIAPRYRGLYYWLATKEEP